MNYIQEANDQLPSIAYDDNGDFIWPTCDTTCAASETSFNAAGLFATSPANFWATMAPRVVSHSVARYTT